MKKLFVCLLTLLVLVGCGGNKTEEVDLTEVTTTLLEGVETPMYEITPIDEESFSYFTGVDFKEGYQAVTADAMIGSIAHSVVVISTTNSDAETLANDVFNNANPSKWICVTAAKTAVMYDDNVVVLVMSNEATTDSIISNFKTAYPKGQVLETLNAE